MDKIIIFLIALILMITISTMIMWGVGNLIIWVFKINYNWTLWHGLASCCIYWLLRGIFNNNKSK